MNDCTFRSQDVLFIHIISKKKILFNHLHMYKERSNTELDLGISAHKMDI